MKTFINAAVAHGLDPKDTVKLYNIAAKNTKIMKAYLGDDMLAAIEAGDKLGKGLAKVFPEDKVEAMVSFLCNCGDIVKAALF